jgi:hypothetical protein
MHGLVQLCATRRDVLVLLQLTRGHEKATQLVLQWTQQLLFSQYVGTEVAACAYCSTA